MRAFERTRPTLRSCLSAAEFQLVMTWWQGFRFDKKMLHYNPVLVHGDLWYGNVLSDPDTGSITGIIDFEDAALDDPAQDFATLLHSGYDFTGHVIEAYRKAGGSFDDNILYRMRKLWSGREFGGLAYAVEMQDEAELEEALDKLRRGPILNPEPHNEDFKYLETVLELT
jgi:aminoglycoside phosphotransferase (APT) family kinase protein